jgi:hypothetical protein
MAFFLFREYYLKIMRMKKISLFALAVASGVVMYAQESSPQLRTEREVKARFGLRAGVNLTTVNMSESAVPLAEGRVTGANSKTAYNAGILVNIPLGTSSFRFQPEVNFSSQGARLFGNNNSYSYEQDLNYLNIPLNFQWVAKNGIFVQTGPQVGFLMSANTKDASGAGAPANMENKASFDKTDIAWTAGVGYLSRAGIGFDARYNLGLRNVREEGAPTTMQGNWRNNVAQFSLIYHFGANR